jgi:glucokinase
MKTFEVLALLCINLCRVSDPEVIILAGGMSRAGDELVAGIQRHVARLAWTCLPQKTPIAVACSGHGGAMGAAFAAERKLRA